MSIERKVAIISGASQGIGAELVQAYRNRNYRVVANSRSIAPSRDPDVLDVAGDIADPATAERVVREALALFGRIDSLVNNAGVFVSKPFIEFTQADYDHNLAVNVAGFFHITQRAAAEMLKQGSGHIVSITAALVDQPIAGVPAALAALTKGALNAVTRSLAIEFASRGVRVNAVAPGIIKTPMNRGDPRRARQAPPGRPHGRGPRYRRGGALSRVCILCDRRDLARRRRPARRPLVGPARSIRPAS
jgi:NAD(P)-dependent dehydrogenase (short-subunit alcohol dehydrogenase family)